MLWVTKSFVLVLVVLVLVVLVIAVVLLVGRHTESDNASGPQLVREEAKAIAGTDVDTAAGDRGAAGVGADVELGEKATVRATLA